MSDNQCLGMFRPRRAEPPGWKRRMHDARALPNLHIGPAGLLLYVVAQIDVRQEQHVLLSRDGIHDFHRVARGAKDIALRLNFNRSVDVADDHMVRIAPFVSPHLFRRAALHQAATGLKIGQNHDSRRVQNLGCFRHEEHAAKGDHVALEILRAPGQFQTVAHHIRKFLDFRILVMMRQDHGLAILLQVGDLFHNRRRGNHVDYVDAPRGRRDSERHLDSMLQGFTASRLEPEIAHQEIHHREREQAAVHAVQPASVPRQ